MTAGQQPQPAEYCPGCVWMIQADPDKGTCPWHSCGHARLAGGGHTAAQKTAWLRSYRGNADEIERLAEEILRWRSLAEKVTTRLDGMPGGPPAEDRMVRAVEKIAGLEDEMAKALEARVKLRRGIERAVAAVGDDKLQQVLRLRYIENMTMEKVADMMAYSLRQVSNLHLKAVERMEIWA